MVKDDIVLIARFMGSIPELSSRFCSQAKHCSSLLSRNSNWRVGGGSGPACPAIRMASSSQNDAKCIVTGVCIAASNRPLSTTNTAVSTQEKRRRRHANSVFGFYLQDGR